MRRRGRGEAEAERSFGANGDTHVAGPVAEKETGRDARLTGRRDAYPTRTDADPRPPQTRLCYNPALARLKSCFSSGSIVAFEAQSRYALALAGLPVALRIRP